MIDAAATLIDALESVSESTSPIDTIKTVLDVLGSLIGIVASLAAFSFVHGLRAKQRAATFGFWSQLRMRLLRMKESLEKRPSLINNMYNTHARESFEEGSPSLEEVKCFKELVAETGSFLNGAPEQMPAYVGWSDDFSVVADLISDIALYDIADSDTGFVDGSFPSRDEYCKKTCDSLNHMIEEIDSRQKKMERELEPWWRRLRLLVSELKS